MDELLWLSQSYEEYLRTIRSFRKPDYPEKDDAALMKSWARIERDFLAALRDGDDRLALKLFEYNADMLGRYRWPHVYGEGFDSLGGLTYALTHFDRPKVLEYLVLHPSGCLSCLNWIVYSCVFDKALKCLEAMARLGVLSIRWEPITKDDVEWLWYNKKSRAVVLQAAGEAGKLKDAASMALMLRWGTRAFEAGLASSTGVTWLDVAYRRVFGSYTPMEKALKMCYRGARPRYVLARLFDLVPAEELARVAHVDPRRGDRLVRWRRAYEARRDAGLVFQAAIEGRPLELGKRLRLGSLAGGAWARGVLNGVQMDALEAARMGGHGECVDVLVQARGSTG